MAKFFLTDTNGNKQGPYNEQQLQSGIAKGIITPTTPLETDTGHKGLAGQIPGLFPVPQPPPPPNLVPPVAPPITKIQFDAQHRKARIHFWTMLYIVSCVIFVVTLLVVATTEGVSSDALQKIDEGDERLLSAMEMLHVGFSLLFILVGIANCICCCFYLYRLWEEIHPAFAQTTPGKAAGFMLIPLWNLYWIFVAFWGLYQSMNKEMESYGHAHRFNESLILKICIAWLVLCTVSTIFEVGGLILFCALSIWTFWRIRKDMLEFIDIKASMGNSNDFKVGKR